MADVNIGINEGWVEGYSKLGITQGVNSYLIQNKSTGVLILQFTSTLPSADDDSGIYLYPEQYINLPSTSGSLYIRSLRLSCDVYVANILDVNLSGSGSGGSSSVIPDDIYTSDIEGVRRLSVDSQPTSFEENTEFKYFDRLDDISNGSQIVYKITTTTAAINVFKREINLFLGGREYLVYPDDGSHTFTGTLADSGEITPINDNLRDGLLVHPETTVTIQRAVGAGIFVEGNNPTLGTIVVTAGNTNQSSGGYNGDTDRAGLSAGISFFVVMNHIGATNNTTGQYILKWEERIND